MTDRPPEPDSRVPLSGPERLTADTRSVDTRPVFHIEGRHSMERNDSVVGTLAFREPYPGPIPLADLPTDGGRSVRIDGRLVAIFRVGVDEVIALDGRCLHREGPVAEGVVRDGVVTCPWHFWRYELATGALIGNPGKGLRRYRVEVRDGIVHVDLPPAPAPMGWKDRLLAAARERDGRGPDE